MLLEIKIALSHMPQKGAYMLLMDHILWDNNWVKNSMALISWDQEVITFRTNVIRKHPVCNVCGERFRGEYWQTARIHCPFLLLSQDSELPHCSSKLLRPFHLHQKDNSHSQDLTNILCKASWHNGECLWLYMLRFTAYSWWDTMWYGDLEVGGTRDEPHFLKRTWPTNGDNDPCWLMLTNSRLINKSQIIDI